MRGDANLNVSGMGTVTLPGLTFGHPSTVGANSTVNLNGGTLAIGAGRIAKASGTATMNFNGGTLQPTVASTTFLTGLNTTNVRNGGAIVDTNGLDITIANPGVQVSAINGLNAHGGINTVTFNIASLASITIGNPYKLMSYAGAIGGFGFPAFQVAALPNRAVGVLSNTGTEIRLTVSSTDFLKWTGATSLANGWDTATQNWKLNSNNNATAYIDAPADAVVFDDSANIANTTVNLDTANVSPASVSFSNATKDYVVQGSYGIGGPTGIAKTGAALVTVATANSYAGPTTISQGAIRIQNNDALGATGAGTTVASGAALQVQGFLSTAAEPLTLSGTGVANDGALRNTADTNTYSGLVTLGGNTRINSDAGSALTLSHAGTITGAFGLTVGGDGDTTIASIIGTGTGNLTKDGSGTATLSGVNTFTGGVVISGGVLKAGSDRAFGDLANTIVVGGGGAPDINGRTLQTYTQRIHSSGTGAASAPTLGSLAGTGGQLGSGAAGTVTFSIGAKNSDTAYSGAITKVGSGALTVSGTLSYTGVTNIDEGTLNVNSALGAGANVVNANGGETNFNVNETLAELNIGAGAVVTVGDAIPAPFAGEMPPGAEAPHCPRRERRACCCSACSGCSGSGGARERMRAAMRMAGGRRHCDCPKLQTLPRFNADRRYWGG